MARKKVEPRYALFCDEAGGPGDDWRSLAVVSGTLPAMVGLEHDLRQAMELSGLPELKWTNIRKRPAGINAAGLFLELATAAAQEGSVRFQLWCWEAKRQPKAWAKLTEPKRMQLVYGKLLPRTARAWSKGRWRLLPDERTGVDWGRLKQDLAGSWRKAGARVSGLKPVDSRRSALVQCCDLLAGIFRHSLRDEPRHDGPGSVARRNRDVLLSELLRMSAQRRLGLRAEPRLQGKSLRFSAQRVARWV